MNIFQQRHAAQISRIALWIFAGHLPVFWIVAWHFKTGLLFATGAWALIIAGPLAAHLMAPGKRWTTMLFGFASMCFSALLVHLGKGMIEMHFHVFVTLAILCSFGDILVVLAAAVTIALHHVGFFLFLPASVFNYEASLGVVLVHAVFVVAECIPACLIAQKIRNMVLVQSTVTERLTVVSREVETSTTHLAGVSDSLADGASRQAALLRETSATIEATALSTDRNAHTAREAHSLAVAARSAAEGGAADLLEMKNAMDEIQSASDNIAKIVRSIDEIAFRTNILALNAAVEAARAGETGRGFAVVADEVRGLAQRSAEAARETSERIADSLLKSRRGSELSAKVSSGLDEIVAKARKVEGLVNEIAGASAEQSKGVGNISRAARDVDGITQSNAAAAEESAASVRGLREQSEVLDQLVSEISKMLGESEAQNGARPSASSLCQLPPKQTKPLQRSAEALSEPISFTS